VRRIRYDLSVQYGDTMCECFTENAIPKEVYGVLFRIIYIEVRISRNHTRLGNNARTMNIINKLTLKSMTSFSCSLPI
jgi:hypothetical protein